MTVEGPAPNRDNNGENTGQVVDPVSLIGTMRKIRVRW